MYVDDYKKLIKTNTSNIYRDFKKAVKSFEKSKGVNIKVENSKGDEEEIYFAWFSKIHYKDREGKIEVNIDIDFKKILYEVKKKILYDISYPLNMKSSYSQRVYYYAKSYEDTGWRLDCIDDLIRKLEAPTSYNNFANFKKFVLEKAKEEINEISDIIYDYEPIKSGRKVTHIRSTIKSKNKNIINYKKMSVEYILKTIGDLIQDEHEAKKILDALNKSIELNYATENNIEQYFKTQVDNAIEYHKTKNHIPLIALIISAIKNNWNKKKSKQLAFNDYSQKNKLSNEEYIKSIENKLLGWDND